MSAKPDPGAGDAAAAPAAGAGDVKPAPAQLTVRVTDQSGNTTHFKIKRNTKMSKVMDAYASRKGVPLSALKFKFDGEGVQATDTPDSLTMEDNDQVDVFLQQVGGFTL